MAVFMFSLMGIPPLAGFWGKLYVFAAAVNADLAWYAAVGALNSVIAVYYYARVIKTMLIDESEDVSRLSISWSSYILVWIMLLPTIGLMLFWNQIQQLTISSLGLFPGS
jgi:NADH-quinone oxidoreductase subunit N